MPFGALTRGGGAAGPRGNMPLGGHAAAFPVAFTLCVRPLWGRTHKEDLRPPVRGGTTISLLSPPPLTTLLLYLPYGKDKQGRKSKPDELKVIGEEPEGKTYSFPCLGLSLSKLT